MQINGPIGEKGWKEVDHLEIKDNVAAEMCIQVKDAMSNEVFQQLLAARAVHCQK
ncbi:hypothetical protein GQ44DRAFT_703624 [Phaeosphaeriaceae sp. PMI808]|nr:hypothetical protein GQ44DRAFT_703624 [Phaeosphaeriaceae sp. PMI808]